MTFKNESNGVGSVVDRLNEAIRENPLAAGLIGAGVVWMLLGAKGLGALAGVARSAAGGAGSAALSTSRAAATVLASAGTAVTDTVVNVGDSVASIVPEIPQPDMDKASEAVAGTERAIADGFQSVAAVGRGYGAAIRSGLSESLERQPLLLGAIGLGIGVGMASVFATTELESKLMGEQGAATRKKLQGFADEAKQRAQDVISEVRDEAGRQGLTPEGAKETATLLAGKVKSVSKTAQEAVAQPFKSDG